MSRPVDEKSEEAVFIKLLDIHNAAGTFLDQANRITVASNLDENDLTAALLYAAISISKSRPTMSLAKLHKNLDLLYDHAPAADAVAFNVKATNAKA